MTDKPIFPPFPPEVIHYYLLCAAQTITPKEIHCDPLARKLINSFGKPFKDEIKRLYGKVSYKTVKEMAGYSVFISGDPKEEKCPADDAR